MSKTTIEWTDYSWTAWDGCTRYAKGCEHCWAEAMASRFKKAAWGPNGTRVKTSDDNWKKPLAWNRKAEKEGRRFRVFASSNSDIFEDWKGSLLHHRVDSHGGRMQLSFDAATGDFSQWKPTVNAPSERLATLDDIRADLFRLIDQTPNLDWLLLTKRPENIRRMWPSKADGGAPASLISASHPEFGQWWPRNNVFLGTSIAMQEDADRNIPHLIECRGLAPVLFVSAEPLLGPVDFTAIKRSDGWTIDALAGEYTRELHGSFDEQPEKECHNGGPHLDQIIVGGESGHGARPVHPQWVRDIRDQCVAAGCAFFFKQWGEWVSWIGRTVDELKLDRPQSQTVVMPDGRQTRDIEPGGALMSRVGKKAAGRLLDGREWNEFPSVQEPAR